jgi:dynein intermediate chain
VSSVLLLLLQSSKQVESVIFHPFAPNLIVGGTYSGQVVIWDLRAKAAPVQRSALSFDGHTHPIYSMACVGTSNAHSLVTASTNGQLCMWSTSNLSTPTDSQMLRHHDNKRGDVAVTRLSFPAGESNSYAVGAEDGSIYRGQLHGNTSGLQTRYQAHHGPVTALDYNNSKTASASSLLSSDTNGAGGVAGASAGAAAAGVGGSAVTCDLLLSSSMDWTVKLWSHRHSDVVLKTFESAT